MINHQTVLNDMVKKHEEIVKLSEDNLVQYALEHGLYLSLGDYGAGRVLITSQDLNENGTHWSGKSVGEWLYSSESC